MMNTKHIHIFGDSHITIIPKLDDYEIVKHKYTASSGMGLSNTKSISNIRAKIIEDLSMIDRGVSIIFKFGQVDIDFVYYLKLINNNQLKFESFMVDSVDKYLSFINFVVGKFNLDKNSIYIMSPYPTVVPDNYLSKSLPGLHFMPQKFKDEFISDLVKLKLPNLRERTNHGLLYSKYLLHSGSGYGYNVIDAFNPLLGDDGVCKIVPNNVDHHLENEHINDVKMVLNNTFK